MKILVNLSDHPTVISPSIHAKSTLVPSIAQLVQQRSIVDFHTCKV